jgi:REP element-mobilizing transposase RayT
MPWIRVWLHFVWSTYNREPWLTDAVRSKVFEHIKQNAKAKGIFIDCIGGFTDHVHCLISLGSDQNIEKIMQLLKGESSFWINKNKLTKTRFAWQEEYFVVSVSEDSLANARRYISNQEAHHRKSTFADEFDMFIKRGGFQKFNDREVG